MRIGITVLTDASGGLHVLAGGKTLPVSGIDEQKTALKEFATKGCKIGGKAFVAGMLLTQYGLDQRKKFPAMASGRDVNA